MTLDEGPPAWEHRQLRQHATSESDWLAEAAADEWEASGGVHRAGLAALRVERPFLFGAGEPVDRLDRRVHGWREEERFEQALAADPAGGQT